MRNKNIITIDGPSGVGKGTLCAQLCEYYGFAGLDTGSLYRAITYYLIKSGTDMERIDDDSVCAAAKKILESGEILELAKSPEIRSVLVGKWVGVVAPFPKMRDAVRQYQIDFGFSPPALADGSPARGAVVEGRDIGTVIFPDAPVKIFLTATADVKAARRYKQHLEQGVDVGYKEILADQKRRDELDAAHDDGRLKLAPGAVLIDNSAMTREEVFDKVRGIIKEKLGID
jgi:cytidylate kinase